MSDVRYIDTRQAFSYGLSVPSQDIDDLDHGNAALEAAIKAEVAERGWGTNFVAFIGDWKWLPQERVHRRIVTACPCVAEVDATDTAVLGERSENALPWGVFTELPWGGEASVS